MNFTDKLAMGTAQWGLDYGATNKGGRLEDSVVQKLLEAMKANGISHLDTAANYGDAEVRIGNLDTTGIDIQTKLSAKGSTREELSLRLRGSLARLNTECVNALLIHDWFALDEIETDTVSEFFEFSINEGLTQHVGISAYTLTDLDRAYRGLAMWDTAQIPINIVDQRFTDAGESFPGIAFQARSIFLQGILLSPSSEHADVIAFREFCRVQDVSPLALCLQFINQQQWLDSTIIAPTSTKDFYQIIGSISPHELEIDFRQFHSTDERLLDPRTWN